MARIKTVSPDEARGIRRLAVLQARRRYGYVPGILRVGLVDLSVGRHVGAIYDRLHLRKSSPLSRLQREMVAVVVNGHVNGASWLGLHTAAVRRLTGDEDLTSEFATTWRTYDLDAKTTSLLGYAEKLTKAPGMIDDADIDTLRAAGWSEDAIYEASALISFFNFSGRMEAASGLPADEVPASARPPEARAATGAPRWRPLARSRALLRERSRG